MGNKIILVVNSFHRSIFQQGQFIMKYVFSKLPLWSFFCVSKICCINIFLLSLFLLTACKEQVDQKTYVNDLNIKEIIMKAESSYELEDYVNSGFYYQEAIQKNSRIAKDTVLNFIKKCFLLLPDEAKEKNITNSGECLTAAYSGNADLQYLIGLSFYEGKFSDKNLTEAKKWFSKSAENGHIMGQLKMSLIYLRGQNDNGAADLAVAHSWLCVLEKQVQVKNSPGFEMWNNEINHNDIWELKEKLFSDLKNNFLSKKRTEKLCKQYVERYFNQNI